jgi:hypothetical protein
MILNKVSSWEYPKNWPPEEFFVEHSAVTRTQLNEFETLLDENAQETALDNFLRKNPSVFIHCLRDFNTAHHGAWVISQQNIRPSLQNNQKGLIPDYILGGRSSLGFTWFVVELKGANHQMLTESKKSLYLNSVANRAIGQVIEYIDYCASAQSFLRDSLKLTDFREPKGLIIMGRETEFNNNERREKFKAAWNRYLGHKIEIRTYDVILRSLRSEVALRESRPKKR